MRRLLIAASCAVWLAPLPGRAAEEGRHYLELPFPQPVETGERIEVREFFWYGCPHCYQLEPALERWVKKLPANVQFVRTPGVSPNWIVHAQAYYAFETLGVVDKLHDAVFRAMHEDKRPLRDEASLAELVAAHGVDPQKFREAFNSFGVRVKLGRARTLNAEYGIHSVPTLTVDGRYVTGVSMAGGEAALFALLDELIHKAGQARKAKPGR